MAFAIPRNVPRFDNDQRAHEDAAWAHAGGSSSSNGNTFGNAFGALGDKKELPMYKDKPYYAQSRRRPLWRRKRTAGVLLGLVLLSILLLRPWLSAGGDSDGKRSGHWSFLSRQTRDTLLWDERRDAVRTAFVQSWAGYREHAWGKDEYLPLTRTGKDFAASPLGWIIVDALDSLMIMNLTAQLAEAREWVATQLNYTQNAEINTFEAGTRLLGGLLSAHYLSTEVPGLATLPATGTGRSGEDLYIEMATDLADRLHGAFHPDTGLPFSFVNLATRHGTRARVNGGATLTSEASGMQLELKYQTKLIGETLYLDAANKARGTIYGHKMEDALPPALIDPEFALFQGQQIGVGQGSYAVFVNLVKQYLQTSEKEPLYRELWRQSWRGICKHLLARSDRTGLFFLGQRPSGLPGELLPKMDQSACVMPGAIALSVTGGRTVAQARKAITWTSKDRDDMQVAGELMRTCWAMHKVTATGVAADATHFTLGSAPPLDVPAELRASSASWSEKSHLPDTWRSDLKVEGADAHGAQQAAMAESLFYLWRVTEDPQYRQMGWEIFHAIELHSTLEGSGPLTGLQDVDHVPAPRFNLMDPTLLSRTLKYFYLLFSPPDLLPLDTVVFSTGAHVFPRFAPRKSS